MKQSTDMPLERVAPEDDSFAGLSGRPSRVVASDLNIVPSVAITVRLERFDEMNRPLVSGVPGLGSELVAAQTTVALSNRDLGASVVVLLETNDQFRPIIIGVLQDLATTGAAPAVDQTFIQADGRRVVVSAAEEIVLRCGDASITLTRAGKILIKGAYVSSRATGVNRIHGGSVEIN